MWSKSVMQQLMPFKHKHDEMFEEQSAENVLDEPTPISSQKNSGNSASNASSPRLKDCSHSPYGFPCCSIPNTSTARGATAPSNARMMHLSGLMEKEGSAPLTIFYGGNVNVFDDVPAEKAHAIMLLASSVNPKCDPLIFSNAGVSIVGRDVHDKSSTNLRGPMVTRYLPQAQKASLARFLEKRRERMLSKSPYASKMVDPEEGLSSSNDVFTGSRMINERSGSPVRK